MQVVLAPHSLERDGCQIRYWTVGGVDRPLLVFTHGAWCDHHMFQAQLEVVAEHYHVLLWDVRGHGLSRPSTTRFSIRVAVADVIAILDHLGRSHATFIGQSMGGNISQEVLFLHPERVRALVLIGCSCNTCNLSPLEQFSLRLVEPLLHLYPAEMLKQQSVRASAVKAEVQAYLKTAFNTYSKNELTAIILATTQAFHYEPKYQLRIPVLLTHGQFDATGNIRKHAPKWSEQMLNCQYVVIPEASHCANQDNPTFFNALLLNFLQNNVSLI